MSNTTANATLPSNLFLKVLAPALYRATRQTQSQSHPSLSRSFNGRRLHQPISLGDDPRTAPRHLDTHHSRVFTQATVIHFNLHHCSPRSFGSPRQLRATTTEHAGVQGLLVCCGLLAVDSCTMGRGQQVQARAFAIRYVNDVVFWRNKSQNAPVT